MRKVLTREKIEFTNKINQFKWFCGTFTDTQSMTQHTKLLIKCTRHVTL